MTTTIIVSIIAFLVITLSLVALLLFAKSKLTKSGSVTIDINDGEKTITTECGSNLLNALEIISSFPRLVVEVDRAECVSTKCWRAVERSYLLRLDLSAVRCRRITGVWVAK